MFGFNFSKSNSKQSSQSGLRGTGDFNQFATNYAGLGNQLATQAKGYANSNVNEFQGQTGEQLAGTDPNTGLPSYLTGYLNAYGNKQFANASAGGSLRGMNTPENTQGIVGSAMQNIGQFLTPYVIDWSKYQQGLPEQYKNSRLNMLASSAGAMAPGLGGQSSGSSSAFGFGVQAGNTTGNSLWG